MDWLAAIGGLVSGGMGIALAIMGYRMGGLRADARLSFEERLKAEEDLKSTTKEFDEYRSRAEKKESDLIAELEKFDEERIDGIENEPDRDIRIRLRRSWIGSVLSKARNATGDESQSSMSEHTSSDSATELNI